MIVFESSDLTVYFVLVDDKTAELYRKAFEYYGCSNSRPIYDFNGNVEMDALSRVSFRFVVNAE